jgi:hypothetical protein
MRDETKRKLREGNRKDGKKLTRGGVAFQVPRDGKPVQFLA